MHQGNTLAEINFTEFTVNKKPGMFLKTRKPFFFQTKYVIKVEKKINVQALFPVKPNRPKARKY